MLKLKLLFLGVLISLSGVSFANTTREDSCSPRDWTHCAYSETEPTGFSRWVVVTYPQINVRIRECIEGLGFSMDMDAEDFKMSGAQPGPQTWKIEQCLDASCNNTKVVLNDNFTLFPDYTTTPKEAKFKFDLSYGRDVVCPPGAKTTLAQAIKAAAKAK